MTIALLSSVLFGLGFALATVAAMAAVVWAAGALYFDLPGPAWSRRLGAILWILAAVVAPFLFPFPAGAFVVAVGFALILAWWLRLRPRLERAWKPQLAVLPHAICEGDKVTIHHVRNFDYRSETDFTERYETRTYDLSQLRGLDLFLIYWSSPWMAHPILSFDFGDGGRICFTIETRQELSEGYSPIRGFYRQFELIYVAADERDAVRLRTNFRRGNNVYLYHLATPPDQPRAYFLDYVRRLNELHVRPEWYHALTSNCTTNIRTQRVARHRFPWDWRLLVNGFADKLLYDRGALGRRLSFPELKRRAHINERARAAGAAADFSARIRAESADQV